MALLDGFLKIDGLEGESDDEMHRGEISLTAWGFGAFHATPLPRGGGGGAGKVTVRELRVTKTVDKASVRLFLACCTGEHLKSATLTCRRAGGERQAFFKVVLTDITVTEYEVSENEATVVPLEHLTLGFTRIELRYAPQNPDGSLGAEITGGWDVLANKKI